MRFLVDECTGPAVARWLREQKHEAFSVQFVVVTERQVRLARAPE